MLSFISFLGGAQSLFCFLFSFFPLLPPHDSLLPYSDSTSLRGFVLVVVFMFSCCICIFTFSTKFERVLCTFNLQFCNRKIV